MKNKSIVVAAVLSFLIIQGHYSFAVLCTSRNVITSTVGIVHDGMDNEYGQICLASEGKRNKSRKNHTDEQRLYNYLMESYDFHTRPVYNASHPVNVYIGITLTQIFDVDERNQVISTNIWLDQEWKDEKLHWDPSSYNGLTVFRMPCAGIWRPDIVLYNSADDYNNGYMQALAMVESDGKVFWPPIVKLRSTCNIDITYFPFDDQICKLKMGSWAYDGFQVNISTRQNPVDLSNYVSNGEWKLIDVKAIRNSITYPCCPAPFVDVTFYIHIRRRTLYYMYNIIIPCVMLSTLTLSGFWMRPDSGEKVTLGLTVLLAFCVFMLLVAENMPATSSSVPLIGIYLTTIMSMTSLSVILAVLTSNINHRGQKETPVPRCLTNILSCISKVMCMKLVFLKPPPPTIRINWPSDPPGSTQKPYHYMSTTVSGDSGCLLDFENGDSTSRVHGQGQQSNHLPRPPPRPDECNTRELSLIVQKLDVLLAKEEEKERIDLIIKQWMEVAEVIDRFLFWIYVIGTVVASVFLLMVYPLFKDTGVENTNNAGL